MTGEEKIKENLLFEKKFKGYLLLLKEKKLKKIRNVARSFRFADLAARIGSPVLAGTVFHHQTAALIVAEIHYASRQYTES